MWVCVCVHGCVGVKLWVWMWGCVCVILKGNNNPLHHWVQVHVHYYECVISHMSMSHVTHVCLCAMKKIAAAWRESVRARLFCCVVVCCCVLVLCVAVCRSLLQCGAVWVCARPR